MASSDREGGKGGKAHKQPLRRSHSTPYDRPPLAVRGSLDPLPAAVSRGRRWLSNLVDPASRVIASRATRLFSSVYRKRLAAPSGENHNTNEDVPELISSPDVRDPDDNPFDTRLSIQCIGSGSCMQESISGTGDIFELEQLVKQKRFSRTETERLTELLHSRTVDAPTLPLADYRNKGKLDEDSNMDAHLSEQALNHTGKEKEKEKEKEITSEFEDQRNQLVAIHENVSSRVNINIPKEGFVPPIEIARAYMKSLKAAPSTQLQQSQIWDKGSPLKNKQSYAADASRSTGWFPVLPADREKNYMTPKSQNRSALYKLPRSPYGRNSLITNPMEYRPHKGSQIRPTRSIEWTPFSSKIRHSVHGKKRGSSDSDSEGFSDVRRVRQKSCLKDLHSSSFADTSSTSFCDQGHINEVDLKGLENVDGRLPSSSDLSVPPQSTQMARKILHQLDKLVPSAKVSSGKKVTFEDASFSKSSLGAFHEGAQKFQGNYYSTKAVNVPGSSLDEPSSTFLARIVSSKSANKEKAKEIEGSPIPSISGAEVSSLCFDMNSAVTSSSDAKPSTRSMNLNNYGNTFLSTQKETILQSAPDDKGEFTRAEHAIFSSVKNSMEKSLVHSVEFVPTSGLMHNETGIKDLVESNTGKDACSKSPDARTSNSLSKPLLFADSTSNAIKFVNMGATTSVPTGKTIIDHPTLELDNGDFTTPASTYDKSVSSTLFGSTEISASSSNPRFSSAAPIFQFGSGNSTIYSFTGLSAASSSTGNGAPKFQFGSGNSTSYSFTGVAASSSQAVGVSSPVFSSIYPVAEGTGSLSTSSVLPISENGIFGVSTSLASGGSSFPSFSATAALSSGTPATFSGNRNNNFLNSSVFQFGGLDSQVTFGIGSSSSDTCSSQFGFATSGAKSFSSSSCLSSSSASSLSLFSSSSLSQASPASICTTTFSSLSSPSFSATLVSTPLVSTPLVSTPLASPSTGFSFGMTANSIGSMPFASSSVSMWPLASTEITTSTTFSSPPQPVFGSNASNTDFGSGSLLNDQMNVEDSMADGDCQAAPMDPTLGQPTSFQAAPSGAQEFQFGNFQNKSAQNSPFQESGNLGFLAGGSFSLGSSGTEKSERRIIRDRRDKRRK